MLLQAARCRQEADALEHHHRRRWSALDRVDARRPRSERRVRRRQRLGRRGDRHARAESPGLGQDEARPRGRRRRRRRWHRHAGAAERRRPRRSVPGEHRRSLHGKPDRPGVAEEPISGQCSRDRRPARGEHRVRGRARSGRPESRRRKRARCGRPGAPGGRQGHRDPASQERGPRRGAGHRAGGAGLPRYRGHRRQCRLRGGAPAPRGGQSRRRPVPHRHRHGDVPGRAREGGVRRGALRAVAGSADCRLGDLRLRAGVPPAGRAGDAGRVHAAGDLRVRRGAGGPGREDLPRATLVAGRPEGRQARRQLREVPALPLRRDHLLHGGGLAGSGRGRSGHGLVPGGQGCRDTS
mmetsp:Transcript_45761/g.141574  ORF Transcript_45761/g.141574 Transcript_45761/m.141574 type:complete len:353 (+) Transcript_45761:576-1634(+)